MKLNVNMAVLIPILSGSPTITVNKFLVGMISMNSMYALQGGVCVLLWHFWLLFNNTEEF